MGCSDLIIGGEVSVVQARDIDRFDRAGVLLKDGTHLPLDLVGLATGYHNLQEGVRRLAGSAVANKVGPVWGFNDEGFMQGMWNRTGQQGFWIMGGALNEARLYSRFLAVLIKADLAGLLPPR